MFHQKGQAPQRQKHLEQVRRALAGSSPWYSKYGVNVWQSRDSQDPFLYLSWCLLGLVKAIIYLWVMFFEYHSQPFQKWKMSCLLQGYFWCKPQKSTQMNWSKTRCVWEFKAEEWLGHVEAWKSIRKLARDPSGHPSLPLQATGSPFCLPQPVCFHPLALRTWFSLLLQSSAINDANLPPDGFHVSHFKFLCETESIWPSLG